MAQPATSLVINLTTSPCDESIAFYKKAFGFQEMMSMPGPGGKIIHAELMLGDILIFVNDSFPEHSGGVKSPQELGGTTVVLNLNVANADEAFDQAIKAGAKSFMPVEDTFWGARYGQVIDPYGHYWALNQSVKTLTPEEMMANMRG
ncbi:MAG: hypothetical protein JWM80_5169 [Cyanobacteria bacterium RYN_339]|nr:hypothetical protein [Cyanobacteria bacterium RYN_339]